MENDLDNDEFELFLKQKADQHKLYPSDNAWKGIYNSLHPGMKWFKVGGSLLLLSTAFFLIQQTSFFNSSKSSLSNPASSLNKKTVNNPVSSKLIVNSPSRRPSINSVEINSNITTSSGSTSTGSEVTGISGSENIHISKLTNSPNSINPFELSNSASSPVVAKLSKSSNSKANDLPVSFDNSDNTPTTNTPEKETRGIVGNRQLKGFILSSNLEHWQNLPIIVGIPSKHLAVTSNSKQEEQTGIVTVRELKTSEVKVNTISSFDDGFIQNINWLQEMAVIKLTTHKKNPLNIQFYFSPTVSYRRLADNQNSSHTGIFSPPVSTRDLNINNYVNHSSAVGAELGSNVLFPVGRNLTFKTGLQLNYTRYNIKAYKYSNEKTSIVLNTSGLLPDTLSSYTSIRNFTGYAPEQLQNQYLQVSIPLGVELKVIGNKRLQFNVAGSIQPTFLLFSDTYLLSTNYLNYTKEPSLVRKWNVNSAFEAFLSYKTGDLRWQLGPQFRYQLMSSYNDRYPIKEYLFEYGFKIGVSKTIR